MSIAGANALRVTKINASSLFIILNEWKRGKAWIHNLTWVGEADLTRLIVSRLDRFTGFFLTPVPRRHLMQSFSHFGLSAVRTAFNAVIVKALTDFLHLGFGGKIGAASLAGFQFDGPNLAFGKYLQKSGGIDFMPQFRSPFRTDLYTRPAADASTQPTAKEWLLQVTQLSWESPSASDAVTGLL